MSFYGNINNYLTKGFSTIKTGEIEHIADNYNSEIDLTDSLNSLYNLSIDTLDDNTDNKLVYLLKQNGMVMGQIDVPLDLILREAMVKTYDVDGDWGKPGTYIHLSFNTEEKIQDVYIDVKELNEFSEVGNSETINIVINENQILTADLTDSVKTLLNYIDINQSISSYVTDQVIESNNNAVKIAEEAKQKAEEASSKTEQLHTIAFSGNLYDSENVGSAKNIDNEDVNCFIFYCGTALDLC